MLIEKNKNLKSSFEKINFVIHHPSLVKTIIQGKSRNERRDIATRLKEQRGER